MRLSRASITASTRGSTLRARMRYRPPKMNSSYHHLRKQQGVAESSCGMPSLLRPAARATAGANSEGGQDEAYHPLSLGGGGRPARFQANRIRKAISSANSATASVSAKPRMPM